MNKETTYSLQAKKWVLGVAVAHNFTLEKCRLYFKKIKALREK